jgi:hypothetical protein
MMQRFQDPKTYQSVEVDVPDGHGLLFRDEASKHDVMVVFSTGQESVWFSTSDKPLMPAWATDKVITIHDVNGVRYEFTLAHVLYVKATPTEFRRVNFAVPLNIEGVVRGQPC